jgi:trans-2,3-dihydro-3-hydroxyanthranilate isomerase
VEPVSTGIYHLLVPLRDEVALARVRPNLARVQTISQMTDTMVLYAFVPEVDDGFARARGFFEAPDRVLEDPATGSAAGPLCAYLHRHAGLDRLDIEQGVQLGRPSRLETSIDGDRVRVGGECIIVLEGELSV